MKRLIPLAMVAAMAAFPAMGQTAYQQRNVVALPVDPNLVNVVQQRLETLGYQVADPAGAFGPETRLAILRFQQNNGLPTTGLIDFMTMRALGFDVSAPPMRQAEMPPATWQQRQAQAPQRGQYVIRERQTVLEQAELPQWQFPHQGADNPSGLPGQTDLRDEGQNPEFMPPGWPESPEWTSNPPGELDPQEVPPQFRAPE